MSDQPLIYDFIEKKTNTTEAINFEYSDKRDLNVVSFSGEVIPFVQLAKQELAESNLYELLTKTFVEREEEEEEEPDLAFLLEFLTKTRQKREEEEDNSLFLIDAKTAT